MPSGARPPFELQAKPAEGFPEGWDTFSATDGSFAFTAPLPGDIVSKGQEIWEVQVTEWSDPACLVFVYRTGVELKPSAYARGRLLAWIAGLGSHRRLVRVHHGAVVGWRTIVDGQTLVWSRGIYQVVYVDGWELSMAAGFAARSELGRRFLDSVRSHTAPPD